MRIASKFNSYYADRPGKAPQHELGLAVRSRRWLTFMCSIDYDGHQCCKPIEAAPRAHCIHLETRMSKLTLDGAL